MYYIVLYYIYIYIILYYIILYIYYIILYIIYNILYYIYYIIYIICTYKYIFFPPLTLVPRGFAAKSALPLGDAMNFRWNMRSRAWRHVELHCWRWGGGFLDDCWLVIYTIYMAFIWHLYLVSIIYTIYIYGIFINIPSGNQTWQLNTLYIKGGCQWETHLENPRDFRKKGDDDTPLYISGWWFGT